MSTQQDIYAAGSENRPPMLNKENYVTWSSRLLRYAKSRSNEKLIYNSIINGPYVRRMIPEPGDQNRKTILLGLLEDIYAAVDSCETAKVTNIFQKKIASNLKFLNNLKPEWNRHVTIVHQTKDLQTTDYTQLYDFLKYIQKEVDDLRAERLAKTHDPLALMENSNNPFNYPIAQLSMNMGQDRHMQMVGGNGGNQFRQYAGQNIGNQNGYNVVQNVGNRVVQNAVQNSGVQNVRNQNGLIVVLGIVNQNLNRNGNVVTARVKGNANGNNGNQIRLSCSLLQAKEFDLMAAASDLEEIKDVNANCILMANLQQASTSCLGTVRFGNDHVAAILGFGDLQWGNILITKVYFVKELGHNLFSVGLSKDEAPEEIKIFLKKITVLLQASVIVIRTDNGTELKNQTLKEYFDSVGISHQASSVRTPQQNAIATACYTQNCSIIHYRFGKTPYELINDRKPDISFLHVFGALCYPKNDHEDIGKLGAKGLDLTYAPSTITTQKLTEHELYLLFEAMYDDYIGVQPSAAPRTIPAINQAPLPPELVTDNVLNAMLDGNTFVNPFAPPSISDVESSSSQYVDPSNMHTFYQSYPHEYQWTKDHPLE
ncbi:retrovirus-related pol polyprotein from transposon TNT 1-94 [Tanacetum coccineum]